MINRVQTELKKQYLCAKLKILMKKILTLLLVVISLQSFGQHNRHGLGVSYAITDYYSTQTDQFTLFLEDDSSTFRTFDNGFRVSYWRELSRWFDVSFNLNLASVDAPSSENDSTFILRRWNNYSTSLNYLERKEYRDLLSEIDLRINLNILDKNKYKVDPYIFSGVTAASLDKWGVDVPIGFGTHVNVSPDLSINIEGARRFAISKLPELDRNQFSIGLVWWSGGHKEPQVSDIDGDGISDENDLCPNIAGIEAFQGCPDSDGDGIQDSKDKCPTVAGLSKYEGCPIPDTDGDGIDDENDKCPSLVGTIKYNGCPVPDTDGDGVNDEMDKCPKVAAQTADGCPVISEETKKAIEKAGAQVHFRSSKAILTEDSDENLDIIAGILKDNALLNCDIKGYTDSTGSESFNIKLSEERAKVCYDYLINKGIPANRLTYKGFGPKDPVADNKTAEGRAKNRRTEFFIRNY